MELFLDGRPMNRKNIVLGLSLVLSAISVALSSYGLFLGLHNQSSKTPQDIWDLVKYSVVELRADYPSGTVYGTALIADDSGTLITCRHLVYSDEDGSTAIAIGVRSSFDDGYFAASLISADDSKDLAFISCKTEPDYWAPVVVSLEDVVRGQRIFSVGNALNFGLSFTEGIVSLPRVVFSGFGTVGLIQSAVAISEGCSGGGLFDGKGELVGMHCLQRRNPDGSINQNFAYSLPCSTIFGSV